LLSLRETPIGEGNDQWGLDLKHPTDFAQHFDRPGQIVDGDAAAIELCLSERQFGVRVQVLDDIGVELLVAALLHLVHTEPDHTPECDLRRQGGLPN
jgi:hypothetical protein